MRILRAKQSVDKPKSISAKWLFFDSATNKEKELP